MTNFHLCMSVRGAIRNRSFDGINHNDGRPMTHDEAFNALCDQLAMGREVIPMGDCDNFDYSGKGCLGHPSTSQGGEGGVSHVTQKHSRGCGVAILAMLTGQPYDQVAASFPVIDFDKDGLIHSAVDTYLADQGFAIRKRYKHYGYFKGPQRDPWPCAPFADVHYVEVAVYDKAPIYHFIVMLRDGSILDPLTEQPRRLSDYFKVNFIAGVYRVEAT